MTRIVGVFETYYFVFLAAASLYNPSHNPSPQSYYNPSPASRDRFEGNCAVTILLQSYVLAGLLSQGCLYTGLPGDTERRNGFAHGAHNPTTNLLQSYILRNQTPQSYYNPISLGRKFHNPTTILVCFA